MSFFEDKSKNKFFTILGGKFCFRVPEGTEGAVSRVNKVGKTVNEVFHDSIKGTLINIRTTVSQDYGKSWNFDFQKDGEVYTLQLSYSNSYATAFLKMLPNIDLSKEISVTPSQKEVDGKMQSSLFIKQDGENIKHAYTKENPNGLPPMVKIMVKGQEAWDDTDRLIFLENMVNTTILPKLGKVAETTEAEPKSDDAIDYPDDSLDISPDDLPDDEPFK